MSIKERTKRDQNYNKQNMEQARQEYDEVAEEILKILIDKHHADYVEILWILEKVSTAVTDIWRWKHLTNKPMSLRKQEQSKQQLCPTCNFPLVRQRGKNVTKYWCSQCRDHKDCDAVIVHNYNNKVTKFWREDRIDDFPKGGYAEYGGI